MRSVPCLLLISLIGATAPARTPMSDPFATGQLVAWCIVPFDARQRGPVERVAMLRRLGLKRVAYDWRQKHVPTFEQEIIEYRKHGIEFFAFWSWHPSMEGLIRKHGIRPQIWQTCPSPKQGTQEEKTEAAAKAVLPLVEQTRKLNCKLGLYNHGGWGGEPANLAAVCRWLKQNAEADHVGIVYNFHHGHGHIDNFAALFGAMKPHLLCVNLNGMNDGAKPKILPIGEGMHEAHMIRIVRELGYTGPIGILDHDPASDSEIQLRKNLEGLQKVLKQIEAASGKP